MSDDGPILRIFEVHAKEGCREKLLENFATTSAEVVRNEPGNQGFFFGKCVQSDEDSVMFVSVWKNLKAVKTRFGKNWQESFMPEGYEDLIENCSVRHLDVNAGWHVNII